VRQKRFKIEKNKIRKSEKQILSEVYEAKKSDRLKRVPGGQRKSKANEEISRMGIYNTKKINKNLKKNMRRR